MHDLVQLQLRAVRSGDRALAAALAPRLRAHHAMRERSDRSLQGLPRCPARWSAPAADVVARLMERLGSTGP
jgi:hypothetical protein